MLSPACVFRLTVALLLVGTLGFAGSAGVPVASYWQVDDVRPGMKGHGRSVFKGSKIENFEVEVLGVLKNTSPGRDLVFVRIAGCDLERSGVIAGMSGSPVYLENKLLGAVAYAWAFGKDPIAGVTPFGQMAEFVESYERGDLAQKGEPRRVRLDRPVHAGGQDFDTVTVAPRGEVAQPVAADGLWLVPLQTPLVAGGFTQHSLNLLRERTSWAGMMPMQAGSAAAHVLKEEQERKLEPGSPLAVAMVTGDFDLSGIGTVTHIEGERVYGWGHPFLAIGRCEFPLMSGYIHTIYPRQSISFKMGSPIRTLGVINADVSTGIAGWLGRKPDMLPLRMTVSRDTAGAPRTFTCEVVRQRALMPQLVYTVLTNSVDTEGELPDELTAEMEARFEFEDRPALVIHDTFSGPSIAGGRAPGALYAQIANVVQILTSNTFKPVRIKRIECNTVLVPGRTSADVDSVQLGSETYAPGDLLKAVVFLRPFKGLLQRVPVELKLPADLPEGNYTAIICDDLTNARYDIRESPILYNPSNLEQVFEVLEVQTAVKRSNLVVRVAVNDVGVALDGQALPNLPASMVEMLGNSRRTGVQPLKGALVSRQATDWVVQGSQAVKFAVLKNKRLSVEP